MNTVKIGNQEWAQENLNIDHFQNDDLIQHAKTKDEWKLANERPRKTLDWSTPKEKFKELLLR